MTLIGNRNWMAGLAAVALAVVCFATAVRAQDQGQNQGQGTGQPARAVRLSYVDGQVTLTQSGQVLAQQAVANTPLFEGMQLTTTDSGKAEIQFEDGSVARLSPDSSMTLAVLRGAGTTAEAELVINSGLAYFELQGGGQAGTIGVEFGDAQVTTSGFTVLRVAMDTPPGQVAVFSGNAHLEGGSGGIAVDLHGGESVTLNGANPANYQLAESIEPDSWDGWNSDRDQALTAEAADQTGASASMGQSANPAWNDLDANGDWYDVPDQGYVWSPYEAASAAFDPYGFGNWMWTPGYGYLWLSGYSWGYLPFQCGAWNYYDSFGWGWAPGAGGCMPWWGVGFYPGANYGRMPHGYRPIPRPILPRHPISGRPVIMVAVNRTPAIVNSVLPARSRNTPVTIAGSTVEALRPLPSRPVYGQAVFSAGAGRTQPGNQAMPTVGRPGTTTRPGYSVSHAPEPASTRSSGWQSPSAPSHYSAPSERGSSGGGSSSHAPSSGGGGSSGGHSASGGGGGGSHSGGHR